MQIEVMFTGVGGQGIQLASKTLALGAVIDGRQALMCGHYAGAMRGGQTDASVVVADHNLRALPILPSAWSAIVMSEEYWESTRERLRPGGVVAVNGDLIAETLPHDGLRFFAVPAQRIAGEVGNPLGASMVLLGAYCAMTGLCSTESLVSAMRRLVPPYRTQHLEGNENALRAGAAAAEPLVAPAWSSPAAASAGAGR